MAEVNVRKRNNKYEYRIELGKINGKRQQKSKGGFRTKAEALKAGREALQAYENCNEIVVPSDITVSDMLDQWLTERRKTVLKQVTAEGYEKKIRLYIKPKIGHFKTKSILRKNLQDILIELSEAGYSKNTVGSVRGILTKSFAWAQKSNMIVRSPAVDLELPELDDQRVEKHVYIENDKIQQIFERFPEGSTSHIPLKLAYHCGLRLGEVFALTWEDIDFENRTLSVNRQIQWYQDKSRSDEDKKEKNGSKSKGGGYWYFSTPKYASYRTIQLDATIYDLLLREKAKQDKAEPYYDDRYVRYYTEKALRYNNHHVNDSEANKTMKKADSKVNPVLTTKTENEVHFICRRESGEYVTPRTMQHTSAMIHKQLNFPEFDFHSLRHTHATMLAENGAPMIYIQYRLGHAKIETTERIYANHLTDKFLERGFDTLQKIF